MKKIFYLIIIIGIVLFISISVIFILNRNRQIILKDFILVDDLTLNFLDEKRVSDYIVEIDGDIVNDYNIPSYKIGNNKVEFEVINNKGDKVTYSYNIEVVDNVAPLAFVDSVYYVKNGSSKDFYKNIFCGDNYDPNPNCYIDGYYDVNKNGTYPVTFIAKDSSGNSYTKKIEIVVYTPSESSENSANPSNPSVTLFSDVVKKYKSDNTKIGLDVSKWQGVINFDQLKEAGVEFVFIRVGWGYLGEYTLDNQFKQNIEEANRVGIPVGIYFYSYASTPLESLMDAKWVISQIKDYKVELPIAFDWEEWGEFNNYNMSFYDLSNTAKMFLYTIEEEGYEGLLYGSKFYLEQVWLETGYNTWLAHYTDETDYSGNYSFWQICNNGQVPGIKGNVDINVWYLDKDS